MLNATWRPKPAFFGSIGSALQMGVFFLAVVSLFFAGFFLEEQKDTLRKTETGVYFPLPPYPPYPPYPCLLPLPPLI